MNLLGGLRWLLGPIFRPLARLGRRWVRVDDPWERVDTFVRISSERLGSQRDFGWYFEGATVVPIPSLDALQHWLSECKYVSDLELFREQDFWQHPCTFERLKSGDCEDFALFAWRKLLDLGHDADFVVGRCCTEAVTGQVLARFRRHAWVILRKDRKTYVFEPIRGTHRRALQDLDLVRHLYVPEFGVGRDRLPYGFAGYLLSGREGDLGPHRLEGKPRDA